MNVQEYKAILDSYATKIWRPLNDKELEVEVLGKEKTYDGKVVTIDGSRYKLTKI